MDTGTETHVMDGRVLTESEMCGGDRIPAPGEKDTVVEVIYKKKRGGCLLRPIRWHRGRSAWREISGSGERELVICDGNGKFVSYDEWASRTAERQVGRVYKSRRGCDLAKAERGTEGWMHCLRMQVRALFTGAGWTTDKGTIREWANDPGF